VIARLAHSLPWNTTKWPELQRCGGYDLGAQLVRECVKAGGQAGSAGRITFARVKGEVPGSHGWLVHVLRSGAVAGAMGGDHGSERPAMHSPETKPRDRAHLAERRIGFVAEIGRS
jgi:hypothetical protein